MADESKTVDANSRLKARVRPSVPPRQPSLLKRVQDETYIESHTNQPEQDTHSHIQHESNYGGDDAKQPDRLVSFTLRVDELVDKELKYLCSEEGITKETFLEAAYLVCKENDKMREELLEVARKRRKQRKDKGVQRRAKTMTRYLAES